MKPKLLVEVDIPHGGCFCLKDAMEEIERKWSWEGEGIVDGGVACWWWEKQNNTVQFYNSIPGNLINCQKYCQSQQNINSVFQSMPISSCYTLHTSPQTTIHPLSPSSHTPLPLAISHHKSSKRKVQVLNQGLTLAQLSISL